MSEKNKRLELHQKLIDLFGNSRVYYQPPENLKMEYPCIKYSKLRVDHKHADNINYNFRNGYQIIIIDKLPDNPIIDKILLGLPLTKYDRHYVYDNLNHDVINIYY